MKLSITDWQKAANARVLIGTVTALDPGANTATITIATGSVAAVPIHYWCNHGADNHAAARVFRVGDEVTALYTGNGDTPSALNMVVMGLKDEIRRCRLMAGILFDLCIGDPSIFSYLTKTDTNTLISVKSIAIGGISEKILINTTTDEKIERNSSSIGGFIDWVGSGHIVSIESDSAFRYAQAANGNNIYIDGYLWDTVYWGSLQGAAISGDYVIAVSDMYAYYRPIDKSNTWIVIPGLLYIPKKLPILFSPTGLEAISCDGYNGIMYNLLISSDFNNCVVTANDTNTESGTIETTLARSKILFADYSITGVKLYATLNYTYSKTYTNINNEENQICSNDFKIFYENGITNININSYLEYNDITTELLSFSKVSNIETWSLISYNSNKTLLKQISNTSATHKEGLIAWIDLRYNFFAKYEQNEITTTVFTGAEGLQYYCDPASIICDNGIPVYQYDRPSNTSWNRQLTKSKYIHSTKLSERTWVDNSTYPIVRTDENYDCVSYIQTSWPMMLTNVLSEGLPFPCIAQVLRGIGCIKHPITLDYMETWFHDMTAPPYIKFNDIDNIYVLSMDIAGYMPENLKLV